MPVAAMIQSKAPLTGGPPAVTSAATVPIAWGGSGIGAVGATG